MPKSLGHIHGLLQHDHTEWYPGYPTDEANDAENTEERKNDGSAVVMLDEVVHRRANPKNDVQYPCDPDELLGEEAGEGEVGPGDDEGDAEDEDEEDEGVGVQREVVTAVVDAATAEGFVGRVAFERKARDGDEASESEEELSVLSVSDPGSQCALSEAIEG